MVVEKQSHDLTRADTNLTKRGSQAVNPPKELPVRGALVTTGQHDLIREKTDVMVEHG
jgi:hypothetical protein